MANGWLVVLTTITCFLIIPEGSEIQVLSTVMNWSFDHLTSKMHLPVWPFYCMPWTTYSLAIGHSWSFSFVIVIDNVEHSCALLTVHVSLVSAWIQIVTICDFCWVTQSVGIWKCSSTFIVGMGQVQNGCLYSVLKVYEQLFQNHSKVEQKA